MRENVCSSQKYLSVIPVKLSMFRYFASLSFFIFSIHGSSAVANPDRPDFFDHNSIQNAINYIRDFAEYHRDEHDITGLSYALIDGENIIWQGGLGISNKKLETKANESTLYRGGALSTLITATLIVQLEQEGKLNLNDLATKYLPNFNVNNLNETPTIRQLLTHHAGLPVSHFKGMWSQSPDSLQQIVQKTSELPASYPVDKIFAYSILGYNLLGRIIENISGKSFIETAREKIFKPLGMNQSTFDWAQVNKKMLAVGYKAGEVKPFLKTRDIPALGMVSNVDDLAKFTQATMREPNWDRMIQPHNRHVKLDLDKGIGLGWQIGGMDTKFSEPIVWRQGSTLLHRSRIAMIPKLGLGIVIMANSSKGFRALDIIATEALDVLLEVKLKRKFEEKEETRFELPGGVRNFESLYSSAIGVIKIKQKEDDYLLDVLGWGARLKPESNGWFRLEYELLGFIPLKLDWFAKIRIAATRIDGLDVAIIRHKGINYLFGLALDASPPKNKWRDRLGVYRPEVKDALLEHYGIKEGELKIYEGVLVFEYNLPAFLPLKLRIPLRPLSDTEAVIPGLGTGLNERVTVGRDKDGEHLKYSGYKLVKKESSFFFMF